MKKEDKYAAKLVMEILRQTHEEEKIERLKKVT